MIKVINVINTKEMKKEEIDVLVNFYKNYDDKKFELVTVIPTKDKLKSNLKKNKIKILEVEGLEKSTWNLNVLGNLIKIFKEEKPDIIHSYKNRTSEIAAKFLRDCKLIFTGDYENKDFTKIVSRISDKIWNDLLIDKMANFKDVFPVQEINKSNEEKSKKENESEKIDVNTENIQNMYETLEREPKMKKVNLLDVFIILIVFVVCIAGYKFIKGTDNVVTSSTSKIIYQVRTSETLDEVYDMIEVGTPIYESRKNYFIGTIIDKQSEKSIRYASNIENGEYVATEIDGCSDIILTIEADADKGVQDIMIQDFELKVGSEAYVKGKGYAAIGYVVSIER